MGDRNYAPNLRPGPAGANFYLLEIDCSQGLTESLPLHLLVSDVELTAGQSLDKHSNTNPSFREPPDNERIMSNSRSGEMIDDQTRAKNQVAINNFSNELITSSAHTFIPLASEVHEKSSLKGIIDTFAFKQEKRLKNNKIIEETSQIKSYGGPPDNERIMSNSTSDEIIDDQRRAKNQVAINNFSNELITSSAHTFIPLASEVHEKTSLKGIIDTFAFKQEKRLKNNKIIEETSQIKSYVHIPDREVPPRAVAVLPTALQIRRESIYPVRALSPRVRFGPVQGVVDKMLSADVNKLICEKAINNQPIFLLKRDEESVMLIDVSDKDRSNWLSLLPLGDKSTANVWLYEEDGKLYGVTTKLIPCRTALSLGYSKKYADEHKLPPGQPVLDLEEALAEQSKWWCFECRRAFGSSTLLMRHMDLCHKEDREPRRKYRCSYCSLSFCRLFTLRRHTKVCAKRHMKTKPATSETQQKGRDPETSNAQIPEDNKIPSDESFLNYTSALDFSTNLFDPDRIYNLDISGSSKSEAEFNLNSTTSKFENLYNNEDYSKFCKGIQSVNDDKDIAKQKESIVVTCPHCEQTMTKTTKRRHLRECSARRLECKCGKVFTRKDVFAQHVHLHHNNTGYADSEIEKESAKKGTELLPYKCEACKMKFKRRGMLVNHLWRVHETTSAEVPLERRIRHYPCSICPKIYRAAAKRDRHVDTHHPGASIRAAPIEGERQRYQPAKCSACPREYMTRSKLLQHIRARHPELAVPTKDDAKPALPSKSQNKPTPRKKSAKLK